MEPAAQFGYANLGLKHKVRRGIAERHDDIGPDASNLLAQKRRAGRPGVGTFKTTCAADTEHFGELVAPCLEDGDVLILTGGLGVGKTHFTKGVSRGLGDGHMVTSPTFALMAVHDQGRIPLFHFDLYRLEHAYELEDTGIFDVLGYEGACLLEWGEQFQDELTDEYLSVTLKRDEGDSDVRTITLEAHGERATELSHLIDKAVQDELA